MPTITPANALICAVDSLTDAIAGLVPTLTCTQDAVDQLMVISKQQACAAKDAATAQRLLRERAQAERVIKEERQAHIAQETTQAQVTASPTIEIKEPNDIAESPQEIPQTTQDENNGYTTPPSANTH
jgi:hypothetical protein